MRDELTRVWTVIFSGLRKRESDQLAAMASVAVPMDTDDGYETLLNFDIDKMIGKGQFSAVYRARHVVENVNVALKKVKVSSCRLVRERMHCKQCYTSE